MTKPKIVIAEWSKRQHFKDREPIWIKIYRALRHDRRWRQLSGDAARLYIDLNLLAAEEEPFGTISLYPEDLAWEVRLTLPELIPLLGEVDASGLITATGYHADIKQISARHQDDDEVLSLTRSREVEGEGEVEKETTLVRTKGWSDDVVHVDLDELALFCDDFGISYDEMNRSLVKLQATELLPIH
jgi:hypothetical protein